MIRVLLVDDQPLIRQGLKAIFEATGEIKVVAEAASGNEAIAAAKARDIDVVCLDIRMPDGDGIYATTEINKQDNPPSSHRDHHL